MFYTVVCHWQFVEGSSGRSVARFYRLWGQNTSVAQDFCFYYMFETNCLKLFWAQQKFWGHKKNSWGTAPECPSVATGLSSGPCTLVVVRLTWNLQTSQCALPCFSNLLAKCSSPCNFKFAEAETPEVTGVNIARADYYATTTLTLSGESMFLGWFARALLVCSDKIFVHVTFEATCVQI